MTPPIPADRCIGGPDLSEPCLAPDGTMLVYVRSTSGGSALMLSLLDGSPARQLSSYPPPRAGRGLGGGCWSWLPDTSAVVYAAIDGNLWLQPVPGGGVRRLTDVGETRAAQAPAASPSGHAVVHVVDQCEVWLQPLGDDPPRRLDDGSSDFSFDPVFINDDAVAWQAWNVPDMAWDSSRTERIDLTTGTRPAIVGSGSIQQPRSTPAGGLLCVRDDTGWSNIWLDDRPLVDEPFEHAGPTWGMGQRSFASSSDGARVAFTRNEAGFGRLCVVDVASGEVSDVGRGVHGQLSWQGSRLAALRTGARTPPQVVVYDTGSWERTIVDVGSFSGWENEGLVEPEAIEVRARDGTMIHARLYRADDAPAAPRGRLICWLHGGPTDQWQVTFMPRLAYWRSRGFNILVPDHRGSTGHGRAYQQAMNNRWGDIDVTDTIDVIRHVHRRGLADPAGTVVIGGSAGGFTVLGVLAAEPALACCAVVAYAVTDLFDIAVRGDRFERHLTHHLVGPIPASRPVDGPYVSRSPISFAARISTPLLMFHGEADVVVPVEQSQMTAERIRARGGVVELVVYPGEGHGFRNPVNQLDEYRRTEAFIAGHIAGHIAPAGQ